MIKITYRTRNTDGSLRHAVVTIKAIAYNNWFCDTIAMHGEVEILSVADID